MECNKCEVEMELESYAINHTEDKEEWLWECPKCGEKKDYDPAEKLED